MRGTPLNLQVKGVGEVLVVVDEEEDQLGLLCGSSKQLVCGVKRKKVQLDSGFYFKEGLLEPRSVLDHRRSPSPPTSTSTLSSSLGCASSDTAGVAAISDAPASAPAHKWPSSPPPSADRREDWPSELQSIPASLVSSDKPAGLSAEDWETMLSDPAPSPGQEQTFLRWIMGDIDDPSPALKQHLVSQGPLDLDHNPNLAFGLVDPSLSFDAPAINPSPHLFSAPSTSFFHSMSGGANNKMTPAPPQNHLSIKLPNFGPPPATGLSLPPGMLFQEGMDEKPQPQLFPPSLLQSHAPQNPAFFYPETAHQLLLPPQPKRHHPMETLPLPKIPIPDPGGPDLFLRRNNPQAQPQPSLLQPLSYQNHRPMKPKVPAGDEQQQQQQALVDQLFKAAGLVEAGNSVGARGILARLNHQLPPSPLGKPLLRSAFYFRDALQLLLSPSPPSPSTLSNPLDVVLKLSAYMTFSEVSPVLQFTNFTSIQAILEELSGSDRIHIIDFDIGVGGQWSSFMQELAQRRCASAPSPVLKITAFVSLNSAHHPLELHLTRENLSHFARDLNIPFEFNIMSLESFDPVSILGMSQDEAIAVNLPVGSAFGASIPTILRLVKQLSPKIVVSVDQGYDRSDLPFAQHFLHALQSNMVLLDSIDAAGTSPDAASKIERFLLQPRIEAAVLGRHRTEKMPPWRTLFASAGFVPLQFSNFTETQAECLLKRVQVRGFHVDKRLASLFLYWQRGELASVSAWRC